MHTPPARAPRHRALLLLIAAVVAVAALAAAGCGSSSSSAAGDVDPAGAVPVSSPLYAEAVVRPDGQLAANVEAVARKILRTDDPRGKVIGFFNRRAAREGITYQRDVEPWLGRRAGAAVTSLGPGNRLDGVLVLASRDDAKARDAIARDRQAREQRTYQGVAYRVSSDGKTAAAVTDGRVLIGSERGVKAAIDASKGSSLAGSDRLRRARDTVGGDQLGFLYLDVRGLLQAATAQLGADAGPASAVLNSVAAALPQTVTAKLTAAPDAVTVDAAVLGLRSSATPGAGGAAMLGRLPRDAWLALGAGDLGKSLDQTLTQLGSSGIAGVGVQALEEQFRRRSGLDLRRDLLAWMGDAGFFVRGRSSGDLGFGLVVDSKDPAATRRAVTKLRALVAGSRGPRAGALHTKGVDVGFTVATKGGRDVAVAAAGDRFVVAAGHRALAEALGGGRPLSGAPEFTAAAAKLGSGYRPAFFLDVPQAASLLADAGGSDPRVRRAKPYLDAFGGVVAGARRDGDVTRARLVATVR